MVYIYHRVSNRGDKWSKETMELALNAIKTDKIPIREAATKYNIPYSTLRKHFIKGSADKVIKTNLTLGLVQLIKDTFDSVQKLGRFETVFSTAEEEICW